MLEFLAVIGAGALLVLSVVGLALVVISVYGFMEGL